MAYKHLGRRAALCVFRASVEEVAPSLVRAFFFPLGKVFSTFTKQNGEFFNLSIGVIVRTF